MAGLRVTRSEKGATLHVPTKDRGVLKYFTSISAMKKFVENKLPVIYFNPRSDFAKEFKKEDVKVG